jgi:hypothetical protein
MSSLCIWICLVGGGGATFMKHCKIGGGGQAVKLWEPLVQSSAVTTAHRNAGICYKKSDVSQRALLNRSSVYGIFAVFLFAFATEDLYERQQIWKLPPPWNIDKIIYVLVTPPSVSQNFFFSKSLLFKGQTFNGIRYGRTAKQHLHKVQWTLLPLAMFWGDAILNTIFWQVFMLDQALNANVTDLCCNM